VLKFWLDTQPLGWVGCTLIPPFEESTGLLPPGEYEASLAEIRKALCWTYRRREIYGGLEYVAGELRTYQVDRIWVDGSFVTSKARPRDVDVAYEVPQGTNPDDWGWLSPIRHGDLKKFRRVDLHQDWPGQSRMSKFFRQDRDGTPKGILRLVPDAA
jgi:hypothetical protein